MRHPGIRTFGVLLTAVAWGACTDAPPSADESAAGAPAAREWWTEDQGQGARDKGQGAESDSGSTPRTTPGGPAAWPSPAGPAAAAPADQAPPAVRAALDRAKARRDGVPAGDQVAAPAAVEPLPPEDPVRPGSADDLTEQARRDLQVDEQRRRELADDLVRIGVRHYQQDDFVEAARHFRMAAEVDPNHTGARRWLADIMRLMDKRYHDPTGAFQADRDLAQVELQLKLSRVLANLKMGKHFFAQEQYDRAIREFEEALERIRWLPTVLNVEHYRREAESYIAECRRAQLTQRNEELLRQRDIARQVEDAARRRELVKRGEHIRELARSAQQAFDRGDYARAEVVLDKVLFLDAYNEPATRLKELARRARHEATETDIRNTYRYAWQVAMTDALLAQVPQGEVVAWPTHADWDAVERRAVQYLQQSQRRVPRDVADIQNQLQHRRVQSLEFNDTPLMQALSFLASDTGVNFVISPQVRADKSGETVTLQVKDLSVASALNLVLSLKDLDYHIKHGAVIIDTPQNVVKQSSELRTYDVRDLIAPLKDFKGPDIKFEGAGTSGGFGSPLAMGIGGEGETTGFTGENLQDLIKENIQTETWESAEAGGSLTFRSGTLIAKNRPEVLADVESLLQQLRQSAGMIVNIETRFVTVEDNFLEDIGVDLRNLGDQLLQPLGQRGRGSNALLDDVRFGSPVAAEGVGTSASPGVFFNDGEDGDIRGRTENLFDNAIGDPTVLTAQGGMSLQFTYLDDIQLEAILRAVRKKERVSLVTAPRLSVFNTQRAHVTIVNQISYIADYTVEVAQGAFLADPIVRSIRDGIVLDVRPIISADRKYVTLELRPTVAELTRPIPTIQTTLGVGTAVNIETPEIHMRKIETTVTVPDGGIVVIGGLKRTTEETTSSGIPWLSDLPIIRFFTSRTGKAVNRLNLLVIVKAKIVLMSELEDLQFH